MFGICIWAEIIKKLENNVFFEINKVLAERCNSQIHIPHLTLDYDCEEKDVLKKLDSIVKNDFFKKGSVYLTKKENFYSLQQDYITNESNYVYHISLAYKVDTPFSKEEIEFANTLSIPNKINKNEYNITIWNCDSVYTKDWFKYF